MKKKKRKKLKIKKKLTMHHYLFAIFIIIFFLFTYLFFFKKNTEPLFADYQYIPLSPTPIQSKGTIQMGTIDFKIITTTPAPTKLPTHTPSSFPFNTDPGDPYSTCGGKYRLNNPIHQNFGDPQCNFTKNLLFTLLQNIDPAHALIWFIEVIPCESGYDPNALQDPSQAVDKAGAWGLFQMGRGKNGIYDHGDVQWFQQAENAVMYNNNLFHNGVGWHYWACARAQWE
jgi:hypothetical protein